MADKERLLKVLEMIAADALKDATKFDGQPFTGKLCGAYMGNHGAAIASLAEIMRDHIKNTA